MGSADEPTTLAATINEIGIYASCHSANNADGVANAEQVYQRQLHVERWACTHGVSFHTLPSPERLITKLA